MSANSTYLNKANTEIKNLGVVSGEVTGGYQGLFYDHLVLLMKSKLISSASNNLDELDLDLSKYLSLEQISLEHSYLVEDKDQNDIDWDVIDTIRNNFKQDLTTALPKQKISVDKRVSSLIDFTTDLFENYYIYDQMYPGSRINPWLPTKNILQNGHLLLLSDNQDILDGYNRKIAKITPPEDVSKIQSGEKLEQTTLGVISRKSIEKGNFSGFLVDKRYSLQSVVLEYLRRDAQNRIHAKNVGQLILFLGQQGKKVKSNDLKSWILLPLKRSGLVGSNNNGYYYLSDKDDFKETYRSHQAKIEGIKATLDQFKTRYSQLYPGADLERDCE